MTMPNLLCMWSPPQCLQLPHRFRAFRSFREPAAGASKVSPGFPSPRPWCRVALLLRGSAFNVEEPGELVGKALAEQDAPTRLRKVTLDDLWERVATMKQEQIDDALAEMGIFDGTLLALKW